MTITLVNGKRFVLDRPSVKELKQIVLENCAHDVNTHRSFRDAKKQHCAKCRLLVPRAYIV